MDRTQWKLDETQMREWLQGLVDSGSSVVAPVEEDGLSLFRPIAAADHAHLEASGKTRWSPKEFLFPRTEALYRYSFKGDAVEVRDPEVIQTQQVLVGVRCCDAAGLVRLDEIFLSGTKDPLYAARREATTVVTSACAAADPECFCTAVGGSPVAEEGSDAQLVPLDDGWVLRVLTDKGEALVGDASRVVDRGGQGRPCSGRRNRKDRDRTDRAQPDPTRRLESVGRGLRKRLLGPARPALSGLQHLRLRLPLVLVLRHEPRGQRLVRRTVPVVGRLHLRSLHPPRLRSQSARDPPAALPPTGAPQVLLHRLRGRPLPVCRLRALRRPVSGRARHLRDRDRGGHRHPGGGCRCSSLRSLPTPTTRI